MPICERRSGGARVTSAPRKRTRPEVARSSPERRLSSVDFPAPLGPMMAWTLPRSKRSETPSTAVSPPKRRVSASVSRSAPASAMLFPQEPGQTAREEEDHCHDHRTDERVPVRGYALAKVLQQAEQERAEHRPVESAFPSQKHGHQHEPRLPPAEERRVDEAVQRGVEIAGQPGQRAADDERRQLVASGGVAQRPHARLVDADSHQHPPERRAHHAIEEEEDQRQCGPDGEVRRNAIAQIEQRPPEDDQARPLGHVDPVGAAQARGLAEKIEEHLGEGERHHDEVHAGGSQAQPADEERRQRRATEAEGKRRGRVEQAELVGESREEKGRQPEERRVPEADEPGIPDQQIEAHGEDAGDHRFAGELQPEAVAEERQERERDGAGGEARLPAPREAHRASTGCPKSPRGRQSNTTAMTAYTIALETPGRSTLPKVSASPTSSAPQKAPLMEPIPPMTTTTNETMRTPSPMPG